MVLQVHEDDIASVVLDAELTLSIVHYIVDTVWLTGSYLLALEVYLKTPENETLLVLFGLLEEHIDDVVNGGRDGQELLIRTHLVALV